MTVVPEALARPYAPGEYEAAHRAERAPLRPARAEWPLRSWVDRQTEPWSRRQAWRALRRHYRLSDDLQPDIDALLDAGTVAVVGHQPTGGVPRDTPKYQLYRTVRR